MFLKNIRLCGAIALLSVAVTPFAASADESLMGSFFGVHGPNVCGLTFYKRDSERMLFQASIDNAKRPDRVVILFDTRVLFLPKAPEGEGTMSLKAGRNVLAVSNMLWIGEGWLNDAQVTPAQFENWLRSGDHYEWKLPNGNLYREDLRNGPEAAAWWRKRCTK